MKNLYCDSNQNSEYCLVTSKSFAIALSFKSLGFESRSSLFYNFNMNEKKEENSDSNTSFYERKPSPIRTNSPETRNLSLPSPIITRRTRTDSTSARAFENPMEKGKVKVFCREKGHGFLTCDRTGEDIFVHISDIEGEYVPLPGDQVEFRLCPIPPKYEKNQAVQVQIVHLTPDVHVKWDNVGPEKIIKH